MTNLLVFIAFLDNLAQQPLISPLAASLGASPVLIGLIVGTYSLANITGNLYSPSAINRVGIRITLASAFVIVALCLVLYALVTNPYQMLLVRALHGLAGGIIVPCIFTYRSYHKKPGESMGQVGRAIGLAALFGPGIAGVLSSRLGYQTPFLALAIWFVIGIVMIKNLQVPHQIDEAKKSLSGVFATDGLKIAYACAFLLMYANGMLAFWFPLQLTSLGFPISYVGMLFSVFGLTAIAIMRIAGLKGSITPIPLIAVGFTLVCMGLVLITVTSRIPAIAVALVFYGLGFGMIFPVMNLLVIQETSNHNRASAFAVFHSFFSLAVFVAPILGGAIHTIIHPFYTVVLLIIVGAMLFAKAAIIHAKGSVFKNQEV